MLTDTLPEGILKNMLHNHEKAINSSEADQIERNIEYHLNRLSSLISEVRLRIKNRVKPEKLLSQRWFWLVVVSVYVAMKLSAAIGKYVKASRTNKACIKLTESAKEYVESIADQKCDKSI